MNLSKLIPNFWKNLYAKQNVKQSTFIFFGSSLIATVFSFIFYFYMAHKLGPDNYAIFGTLMSIFAVFSVSINTVCIVLLKYISQFEAKCQFDKIHTLFSNFFKLFFFIGLAIVILVSCFGHRIASELQLPSISPLIILAFFIFAYLLLTIIFNTLNGLQLFTILGINKILLAVFELALGVVLVSIGFLVNGPIIALFAGAAIMIPIGIFSLKPLRRVRKARIGKVGLNSFLFAAVAASICIGLMLNMDVILVKHYFSATHAGYYAAAATMISLIFFTSNSFSAVIFPRISELSSNGKRTAPLLRYGLFYTFLVCLAITIAYFAFPRPIVNLFFGATYKIYSLIGFYAISTTFLSLINIIVMYNLAIRKLTVLYVLFSAVIIEFLLLTLFHTSLLQIILMLTGIFAATFIAVCIVSRKEIIDMLSARKGYIRFSEYLAFARLKKH